MRRPRALLSSLSSMLVLSLLAGALGAQERSLRWPSMHVEARLDRDGVLHVVETQEMRFTGAWNGGERRFDVRVGQSFDFEEIVRLDSATGAELPMVRGDLERVDGYDFTGSRTLRWRSRLEGDPPFEDATRTYRLSYRYGDILVPEGDGYRLDHDFAFRDREGVIEAFTLSVAVDPVWGVPPGFTGEFGPVLLEPGVGFVVNIPLRYTAAGRPAGVSFGAGATGRLAVAAALLLAVAVLVPPFFRRERGLGRFEPALDPGTITERWLEETVFRHPPEVVGAAWDDSTGAAEVTAVLARLESERKIRSRVESKKVLVFSHHVLHLELLASRLALNDYERSLIDGLFVNGQRTVSTSEIRKHYEKTGFDPSTRIKDGVERRVATMVPDEPSPPVPSWTGTALLVVGGMVLTGWGLYTRPADAPFAFAAWVGGGVWYGLTLIQAALWRTRVERAMAHTLRFLLPLTLLLGAFLVIAVRGDFRVGIGVLGGVALYLVALWRSTLTMAMWRKGPAHLALRRALVAARRHFERELRAPAPALRDAWFPWLIGMGLGTHMDKWFRAFGGAGRQASGVAWRGTSSGGGSVASGGGSGGWSGMGGGGGFAGGGSSGAWVAAASSVAAGVARPSSSSGGGSSRGGSSSGGGGGGGW